MNKNLNWKVHLYFINAYFNSIWNTEKEGEYSANTKPLEIVLLNIVLLEVQMFLYCISCFWVEDYKALLEIIITVLKSEFTCLYLPRKYCFLYLKCFQPAMQNIFSLSFLIANTRCITNRPLHNIGSSLIYFSCSCSEGDNRGYCKYLIAIFCK